MWIDSVPGIKNLRKNWSGTVLTQMSSNSSYRASCEIFSPGSTASIRIYDAAKQWCSQNCIPVFGVMRLVKPQRHGTCQLYGYEWRSGTIKKYTSDLCNLKSWIVAVLVDSECNCYGCMSLATRAQLTR